MPTQLLAVAFVALGIAGVRSDTAQASPTPAACEVTQAKHREYVTAVYRKRERISRRARERMNRLKDCAKSAEAERNMVLFRRREARAREERKEVEDATAGLESHLASIAACESGGNPRAIGGGGAFRGKYQFTFSTWASVGGKGDPAQASEAEQDLRAAILLRREGPGHWPVCG